MRFLISLLLGAAVCAYAVVGASASKQATNEGVPKGDKVLFSWDFTGAGDTLGWQAGEGVTLELKDGALWIVTSGERGAAIGPEIKLVTNGRQYFRMMVKKPGGRTATIMWGTGGPGGETPLSSLGSRSIRGARTMGAYTTCVVPGWEDGLAVQRLWVRSPYRKGEYGIARIEVLERAEGEMGWLPDSDVDRSWVEDGKLIVVSSGASPTLVSPKLGKDAKALGYATFRLAGAGAEMANMLFKSKPDEEYDVSKSAWIELSGGSAFRTYVMRLEGSPGYQGNIDRLALQLAEMQAGQKIELESLNLGEKPLGEADLWIEKFAIDPVVIVKGNEAAARMWIRNSGGTASAKGEAKLAAGEGISVRDAVKAVEPLGPGERREVRWEITADAEGDGVSAKAEVSAGGKAVDSAEAMCVVTGKMDGGPLQRLREEGVKARVTDAGMVVVGNERLAVYFPPCPNGYGPGFLMVFKDGAWKAVAAWKSLGELVVQKGDGQAERHLLRATLEQADAYSSGDYADLELRSEWTDSDGRKWNARHVFSLEGGSGLVEVVADVRCDKDAKVFAFRPLVMLALGEERELGFFPGLEYLLEGERSSGMDFVRYPFNNRLVPNPYEVTIPLMAVVKDGVATGMIWDPLQTWDWEHYLPNAMYASPNYVDGESDHLMALFVPSQEKWVEENATLANVPYELAAGKELRLRFDLFAREGKDFDAVLGAYLERTGGLPATPEMAYGHDEAIKAVMYEYTSISFERELVQWHRYLPDPHGPAYIPERMLHLFWEKEKGTDGELGQKISEVFEYVKTKRGEGELGGGLNYYYGPTKSLLRRGSSWIQGLVGEQKPDGSFGYVPEDEEHLALGTPGDSSSGYTAAKLVQVWRQAVRTGDERAIESGLKGLEYLDQQPRPEGAQTWELQLHVPDVLACADVIECYVSAYQVTRDERFLKEAVTWANRGMPFIYLWNPPERPVMRYGSIPVFGGSWYKGGWFGKIVQWNGLRYANALMELSEYDDSADWRKVAKGLVDSAIAQQRPLSREGYKFAQYIPDCGHVGMYPDAYDATKGTDAYHWCLSGQGILDVLYRVMDEDPSGKVKVVWDDDGKRWMSVSSAAYVEGAKLEGGRLTMQVRMRPGITHYLVVNRAEKPKRVLFAEKELQEKEDLDAAADGYAYGEGGMVAVKVRQTGARMRLAIEF